MTPVYLIEDFAGNKWNCSSLIHVCCSVPYKLLLGYKLSTLDRNKNNLTLIEGYCGWHVWTEECEFVMLFHVSLFSPSPFCFSFMFPST